MSRINLITTHLATLLILVISASAFYGGYLGNQINEQAETKRDEAAVLAQEVDRMFAYAQFLVTFDSDRSLTAEEYFDEAAFLSWELAEISAGLNVDEVDGYLSRIENLLYYGKVWILGTYTYAIQKSFTDSASLTHVEVADKESFGFDMLIARTVWEDETPAPVRSFGLTEFMNFWGFEPTIITAISAYISGSTQITTVEKISVFSFKFILEETVSLTQEQANILEAETLDLLNRAETIATSITIITIATILASTMANQLDDREIKHALSKIYANQKGDDQLVVGTRTFFPTLIIILATLLSLGGLILATMA